MFEFRDPLLDSKEDQVFEGSNCFHWSPCQGPFVDYPKVGVNTGAANNGRFECLTFSPHP